MRPMNFTPGEWVVKDRQTVLHKGINAEFLLIESDAYIAGGGIALVHIKDTDDNARLIANAKRLYSALSALTSFLNDEEADPRKLDYPLTEAMMVLDDIQR